MKDAVSETGALYCGNFATVSSPHALFVRLFLTNINGKLSVAVREEEDKMPRERERARESYQLPEGRGCTEAQIERRMSRRRKRRKKKKESMLTVG